MYLNTPEQIDRYRLLTLQKAVKLELLGMRHSSGQSANKRAKALLGLPAGAKRVTVLKALDAKLKELS